METKLRARPQLGEQLRLRSKLLRERRRLMQEMEEHRHTYELTGRGHVVDAGDMAASEAELDLLATMTNSETDRLFEIDEALARLERGEYGVCQECGKRIAEARLAALPQAELCVRCERQQEAALWAQTNPRDLPPYLALDEFRTDEEREEDASEAGSRLVLFEEAEV